jgi:hypothetical protein
LPPALSSSSSSASILNARQPQRARRRQPGNAATGDQHAGAALHAGRGQAAARQQIAQRVAARHVDARKAACSGARRLVASRGQHAVPQMRRR